MLTKDFFALLDGQHNTSRPGLKEGIEASVLAIAADQSVKAGRPVYLDALGTGIFGVPSVANATAGANGGANVAVSPNLTLSLPIVNAPEQTLVTSK